MDLDQHPAGVPNTLEPTGEQWDFPNVWAPMQVSFSLLLPLSPQSQALIFHLAYHDSIVNSQH